MARMKKYNDFSEDHINKLSDIKKSWQAAIEYKQEEVELREIKVNRSFVELASKYCELQAEKKKLREALKFYADPENYSKLFEII
jgi:lipopolysaccharide biosynthesis regulator YciM